MSANFTLHQQLEKDTIEIKDLSLCKILLMNNKNFPWLILVPKKPMLKEIIDLSEESQQILMKEIAVVSRVLQKICLPYKLNIAALGNVVEQLHIHIIARYKTDIAWPKPVFGCDVKEYSIKEAQEFINKFRESING